MAAAAGPLAVPVSAADAAGRVMPPGGIGDCVPEALALAPIGSGGPRPRGRMPMKAEPMRILVGAGVAAGAATLSYPLIFRRRCLTWGARPEEVTRELPGDELLRGPDIVSTRAITVNAPPGAVWPWLVQMGSGRGGAYTYDWIENIFGL